MRTVLSRQSNHENTFLELNNYESENVIFEKKNNHKHNNYEGKQTLLGLRPRKAAGARRFPSGFAAASGGCSAL